MGTARVLMATTVALHRYGIVRYGSMLLVSQNDLLPPPAGDSSNLSCARPLAPPKTFVDSGLHVLLPSLQVVMCPSLRSQPPLCADNGPKSINAAGSRSDGAFRVQTPICIVFQSHSFVKVCSFESLQCSTPW